MYQMIVGKKQKDHTQKVCGKKQLSLQISKSEWKNIYYVICCHSDIKSSQSLNTKYCLTSSPVG